MVWRYRQWESQRQHWQFEGNYCSYFGDLIRMFVQPSVSSTFQFVLCFTPLNAEFFHFSFNIQNLTYNLPYKIIYAKFCPLFYKIIFFIIMQAVDSTVFLAFLPFVIGVGFVIYLLSPYIYEVYRKVFVGGDRREAVDEHPLFGAGQCSICLSERKRFEISGTCGHSFCAECILQIYRRENDRINCPLCRKPLVIMIKSFNDEEGTAEQRHRIQLQIDEYNRRFDDNRPLIRRLLELPNLIRLLKRYIFNLRFLVLFIRSLYFLRLVFFIIFYVLLPFDFIPENVFGFIGYLDDLFISAIVILFSVVAFSLFALRRGAR